MRKVDESYFRLENLYIEMKKKKNKCWNKLKITFSFSMIEDFTDHFDLSGELKLLRRAFEVFSLSSLYIIYFESSLAEQFHFQYSQFDFLRASREKDF